MSEISTVHARKDHDSVASIGTSDNVAIYRVMFSVAVLCTTARVDIWSSVEVVVSCFTSCNNYVLVKHEDRNTAPYCTVGLHKDQELRPRHYKDTVFCEETSTATKMKIF